MRFIADVHLHSRFSRATSRELTPENLYKWSALKGVNVVGTGGPNLIRFLTVRIFHHAGYDRYTSGSNRLSVVVTTELAKTQEDIQRRAAK